MADPKKSTGEVGNITYFIAFLIILFILWVITGGPEKNTASRTNQFMNPIGVNGHRGETYRDDVLGKPGSVTNVLPFLK